MATPKTKEEALAVLNEQQDKLRTKLRTAMAEKDQQSQADLLDQMYEIDSKKRALTTVGAVGSGLQSGLKSLLTGPLDIGMMARNFAMGEDNKLPSEYASEGIKSLFSKYMGTREGSWGVDAPQSEDTAVPFRMAQAFGSSAAPGTGAKMLAAQTAVGGADAALGDTGMLSLGFGLGQIGVGGFTALKNMRDSKKMKAFVEGLPSNEANAFNKFMMTGQGSDNPLANAAFQKLSADPKYSEIFATLRKGATEAATEGVAPTTSRLTEQQATTASVTGISAKIQGLKENMKTAGAAAFERAYGFAGDKPIVDPTTTLERIRKLKAEYTAKGSPDSEKAVQLLSNLEAKLSPTGTTASYGGSTARTSRTVTGRDAAGMPITSEVPMTVGVPGSPGYSFSYGDQKMTVPQIQGWLSEFGKKASSDGALFGDLSLPAQDRIMKSVFGGLKDDLRASVGTVSDSGDRQAILALIQARKQTEQAAAKYNDTIAQGLPKWLKDTPLNQITPEDFHAQYVKLNSGQRQVVRGFLEDTDNEALKFTDRKIWDDFVSNARSKNPDGTIGTNLEKLAANWNKLPANEKDALTTALGTNASDFDKRMKDAEVFTRKMSIGQPSADDILPNKTVADIEAVVGASPAGYSGAKLARTALQTVNAFGDKVFGGLSDDQLMKVLLTPEGKSLLSKAKLQGSTAKVLDELNNVSSAAVPALRGAALISTQKDKLDTAPPIEISDEDIITTDSPAAPAVEISDADIVLN